MHIKLFKGREDDREMYYRDLSRNRAYSMQSEMERNARHFDDDLPRRKASINELSEDEIVFAYNKLRVQQNNPSDVKTKNEDLSSEIQAEFQRWMEMKRKDEKSNVPVPSKVAEEKVNTEATEISSENVNVEREEHEAVVASESNDFDEFKDVISDKEEEDEGYLKIPLVIVEEDSKDKESSQKHHKPSLLPTVIESNNTCNANKIEPSNDATVDDEHNTIEAKITLSNTPLAVVTSLSSSNISIASDKSGDDAGNKSQRPAKHSKGRAPPPPPPNTNVTGHFYDQVTMKYFKETEL